MNKKIMLMNCKKCGSSFVLTFEDKYQLKRVTGGRCLDYFCNTPEFEVVIASDFEWECIYCSTINKEAIK